MENQDELALKLFEKYEKEMLDNAFTNVTVSNTHLKSKTYEPYRTVSFDVSMSFLYGGRFGEPSQERLIEIGKKLVDIVRQPTVSSNDGTGLTPL